MLGDHPKLTVQVRELTQDSENNADMKFLLTMA